jgi:L-aspartate oxidase
MDIYDPRRELAPRDIVRARDRPEMKRNGFDNVLLDVTSPRPAFVRQRFPQIYERCLSFGIDITKSRSRSCRQPTTCAVAS